MVYKVYFREAKFFTYGEGWAIIIYNHKEGYDIHNYSGGGGEGYYMVIRGEEGGRKCRNCE